MIQPFWTLIFHLVFRHGRIPGDDPERPPGYLVVLTFLVVRIADLQLLGQGLHALDPRHRLLGNGPFSVAVDVAGQGHDTVFDTDADMRRIERGFKFELVQDVLPEGDVAL